MSTAAHDDPVEEGSLDGRRARRERGRQAVIDAMIDLVLETGAPPAADAVVERAGVSQASLFRYFSTLDELRHEAIGRYFERFDDLITVPAIGDGSLPERIDRFVAARDAFYERTAPMARLARRMVSEVPELSETLDSVRSRFSLQVAQHFDRELGRLDPSARELRAPVIAALTSFESWDQLGGLDRATRRSALADAIARLLDDRA